MRTKEKNLLCRVVPPIVARNPEILEETTRHKKLTRDVEPTYKRIKQKIAQLLETKLLYSK